MKRRRNPLQVRIRALSVPKLMSPRQYLRSLLGAMHTGRLPRGIKVELYWRNPQTLAGRTRDWQSGEFLEVLTDSSPGFATVVQRSIVRKLQSLNG